MTETETVLTEDQRRRVEALKVARQTFASGGGVFGAGSVDRAVSELIELAEWVLEGILPESVDAVESVEHGGRGAESTHEAFDEVVL